ncbi:MAG: hypothetical protein PHS66_03745 [Candidatus Omnitrophica bacterium]|nr:hypothetical protein [Candidatus Omnitrophota bacterium]
MKKLLNKFSFVIVAGLMAVLITGCAKKPDKDKMVAEINNFQLMVDDFMHEAEFSLSGATKEQIFQDVVVKELLLQEAQKNSLDKNRRFMKEIEDYWKQALIKRLIFIKGEEFLATVKVGKDEVKAQYDFMAKESEGRIKPYEQMAQRIEGDLKIRKARALLDQWVAKIRNNAKIKKYDRVFDSIVIEKADNQDGGTNEE